LSPDLVRCLAADLPVVPGPQVHVSIGRESLGVGVFRKGGGDFHHHRSIGRVQRAAISSARLGVADQRCVRECPLKRALIP
jgi:hypothetical protein